MSIHLMSLVWEIDFPTPTQKLALLRLADYANDEGSSIFPAVDTVARQVGASKRQIQYALRCFEECGLIVCLHRGGSGAKDTNKWQLNADLIAQLALQEVRLSGGYTQLEVVENKGAVIAPSTLRRVQSTTIRVQSAANKGAADRTRLTTLEPPRRTFVPADAGAEGNFESEKVKVAWKDQPRVAVQFEITSRDAQWSEWISWHKEHRPDRISQMQEVGKITVFGSRWPSDGCAPPRIEGALQ